MGPIEPRGPGCPGGPGTPGKPGLPFGPGEPVSKEQLISSTSLKEGKGSGDSGCKPCPLFLFALCLLPSDTPTEMSHRHFKLNATKIDIFLSFHEPPVTYPLEPET